MLPETFIPKTIAQASQLMQSGLLSSSTLVKHYLERIKKLNPILNALITVMEQQALETAAQLDFERHCGQIRGLLHGIPIVLKDNIDTAGIKTTVGAQLFSDRIPSSDAKIIQKLKSAGAVILGKTNLSEFAADLSGNNSFYGNTCNFWNSDRSSGGSSSGSATAIAAGFCLSGIGTDTGGSIRVPASWSGVVGLRPTYGLVSNEGIFPRAFSFDTVGLMANCVEDVAILLDAVLFPSFTSLKQLYPLPTDINGLKLGVIANYTWRGIDAEVALAISHAISIFKQLGAQIVTINSPFFIEEFDEVAYSTIALYEFRQILLDKSVTNTKILSKKVQNDLLKGGKISHHSYKQALQKKAKFLPSQKLFQQVDAILTPTTPMVAPLMNAKPEIYQLNRRFMVPFSFMGVPAISLPCGFCNQGLPIGLQIVGNSYAEALILRIALAFQIAYLKSKIQ
ncbi:amidase [Scytonema sp. UIC 10036]|uniref:amidase n=1 Tax=Scytonema sp. UIC 10036 TaxID=2304196 RepID=UPI0012DA8D01|nr:amidase [Scytonema sp. UIC 10036]MUH00802.1 amidase [Scytonema sp. UIC 10036]